MRHNSNNENNNSSSNNNSINNNNINNNNTNNNKNGNRAATRSTGKRNVVSDSKFVAHTHNMQHN